MGFTKLRYESIRTVNRTRKQCREEGDISGKLYHVPARFNMFAMNLYQITDQFKRKETHADRHDDVQRCPRSLQPHSIKQLRYRLTEEIQVLEVEQQTDSQDNTEGSQVRSLFRAAFQHDSPQP